MYAAPHLSQPQISHSSVSPSHQYQSQMDNQTSSVPQNAYHSPQVLTQPMTEFPQLDSGLVVPMFTQGDDPIACLNKEMAFLSDVAALRFHSTNNQLRTSSNPRNQATIQDGRVTVQQEGRPGLLNAIIVKESGQILDEEQLAFLADPDIPNGQATQTTIPNNVAFQTEDLDSYEIDCDDVYNAKAVLMANLSNYGSDVISEVPHSESYHNDMDNQSVHAMQDFEQSPVVDFLDNEITSDRNIIPYSQYVQETQQAAVQDTNLYAQQDSMILSVIEQMSEQMINHRLNIDLSTREKMIDSQMDDMIKEKLALKQQIDSLEQNLSNQIKEKESLLRTLLFSKMNPKKKKPQVFYDDTHKQALGYQNPFYLKKAQRIKPTLYDGSVISSQHVVIPVIDDEETLILEELLVNFLRIAVIMEYLVKISKKARILELKRRHLKITVLTSYTSIFCLLSITVYGDFVNLEMQRSESCDKCFDLDVELLKKQNAYNELLKSYSQLEKHCISLELTMQLNQEIFQKDKSCDNQNALEIPEYFENNELKA
ncbi:hypothetical protein Tco_1218338 [Tanacetum coccineum]